MQVALDGLSSWAEERAVEMAAEKTEAVVITSDPTQVSAKCRPPLLMNGRQLSYSAEPRMVGVTLDSQLRFGPHARHAAAKLSARTNMLRALAGSSWGADEHTLRTLYVGHARPAAMYAVFFSPFHLN